MSHKVTLVAFNQRSLTDTFVTAVLVTAVSVSLSISVLYIKKNKLRDKKGWSY